MYERFVEPFIEHQGERRAFWLRKPRPIGKNLLLARAGKFRGALTAGNRTVLLLGGNSAFGTGGHGTTEGCLVALEERIDGGETVLDAGTGTGILAIAAAKLGARRVTAVDLSAAACDEARRNVALNGVSGFVEVVEGGAQNVAGRYDLVVANLRTPILVPLLPGLIDKAEPGGILVLSGILERELVPFLSVAGSLPVEGLDTKAVCGWVTLSFRRKESAGKPVP